MHIRTVDASIIEFELDDSDQMYIANKISVVIRPEHISNVHTYAQYVHTVRVNVKYMHTLIHNTHIQLSI